MNEDISPSVVCLGFFDGVHLGHQALLRTARQVADQHSFSLVVHTFDHAPVGKGNELTTLPQRVALLRHFGADSVSVSTFDNAMRCMSGEDFFRSVLLGSLNARWVVCGTDHRFGYKGQCGIDALRRMCEENNVGLSVVEPVLMCDGLKVSSTAIRALLSEGKTRQAEEMLGHTLLTRPGSTEF